MEYQKPTDLSVSNKIEEFIRKHTLPTESDITRYATYLTLKYGGDAKKVKKDIIEKVKIRIKNAINRKEINRFFAKYPQPKQTDVDDFVKYILLINPKFHEDELRHQIEKERLYRKFHEPHDVDEASELDKFIDIIKTLNNKKEVIKTFHEQGLLYLIKIESKVSDKLLDEFIELIHG